MKLADDERELTRLLAEEPSAFGSGLSTLRNNLPDAAELASLASRLELQGLNVSSQAVAKPARSWKKWVLGGGGGAAMLAAWLAWRGPHVAPDGGFSKAQAQSRATAAEVEIRITPPARDGSSTARSTPTPALGGLPSADGIVTPATAASPATSVESAAATSAVVAASPRAVGVGNDSPSRSANVTAAGPGAASPASTATASSAPLPAAAATLPTEIELLRDARFALRQAPGRALDLTDQHVRLYPQGKLAQERELLAISALVALGRRTAALSRAASFERSYPLSPYRKQVAELLQ